jgi:hypothetical protein
MEVLKIESYAALIPSGGLGNLQAPYVGTGEETQATGMFEFCTQT